MPVTATHLVTERDADGGSTSTTSSISPSANKLVLMWVFWAQTGNPPDGTPSVSGANMTWTAVLTETENSRGGRLFRSLNASPGSGALTITFTGTAPNWTGWTMCEFGNVDTTGSNGANAVVQSASADDADAGATSLTVTLAAFGSTDNATAGFFGIGGTNNFTVGSGFTQLGAIGGTTPGMLSEWKATNDTSVDSSVDGSAAAYIGAAVEIKFVAPATVATDDFGYIL